ncbi:NADH:flavin oxidoreductase/NADH oxidase [Stackebrandtia soli]|uniref:NADH:flavin oxidoreductase/NADH oxidase n=1 Tax=Stackebrandtia soli TaxID=1892856 RepID=UPI0039E8424B
MTALFESLSLRDVTVRNRIWLAPMCQYSVFAADGLPTSWHLAHLGARATGGFGLVMAEATAVVPEGRISPHDTGLWSDAHVDAWRPITGFLREYGATSAIQLAHAGRKASTSSPFAPERGGLLPAAGPGWDVVGPSPIAFDGLARPHELTVEEISAVVRSFADAAVRADHAGFDVVELHAAHGYLLHEFLSPLSNVRTDAYGGSLENRMRIVLETAAAVREAWPAGKPLFVRLSATDWVEGGWDVDGTVALSARLRELGVDLIDVSSGGSVPNAVIPVGPGYQVPFARSVRDEAKVATGAVGLITEPRQAEAILAAGDADAVLLGRVALREPGWPQRAAAELGVPREAAPYPPQYQRGAWPSGG